jgi:D-psicose/D-tagatose/L-ribulose 3-epimerase
MRFGMNLLLWTDTLHDGILPLLDDIKQIGFDAVEIPIFEYDVQKYQQWGKHLDNAGLARTGVTVRGADDNPISPDPAVRKRGVEANKAALDCAAAAGCETLCGPYHSALGFFTGAGPTADEWRWGVDSMREVAEYADKLGLNLGVEYLNRFECYFLNTAADGARFCRDVNHPRCKMMYDTFHAHIEEKSIPEAIRALKGLLIHVHISENDRSTPGKGTCAGRRTSTRWPRSATTI